MPVLAQIRGYQAAWLKADLAAGLSVAAVSLPSAIAYPAIAGLPTAVGLFATIFSLIGYALLVTAGLVQEHDFGEGFKRYEPLESHSHHEHLICLDCGKVVEFSSERIERMKALIADEHGFRHHHHRLEIYGICRDCQRRDAVTLETRGILSGGQER